MRAFIYGTIRPISFLAWIPPCVGAFLTGEPFGLGIVAACVGAVVSVGVANSFNNLIDRGSDKLDATKKTLAAVKPVAAYWAFALLLPIQALVLRRMPFHHLLLTGLFIISFWYSYLFSRLPVIKRLFVAGSVAATAFLAASHITIPLLIWTVAVFYFIYRREIRKDQADMLIDQQYRFWRINSASIDWWVISAPLVAVGIVLCSSLLVVGRISAEHIVIALGVAMAVWSSIQIRYRYRWYRMQLRHRTPAGRLGMIMAHVVLAPSFIQWAVVVVVTVISASILYRSFLPKADSLKPSATLCDAISWATLPTLVMLVEEHHYPILSAISTAIFLGVFFRERWRLARLQPA